MTLVLTCEWCGEIIDTDNGQLYMRLQISGWDSDDVLVSRGINDWFAHFHSGTDADPDSESCWYKARDAIWLAVDSGLPLERIPVATHQAISAQRRKHRHPAT